MALRPRSRRVSRAAARFLGRAHIALFACALACAALFVLCVFAGLIAYAARDPAIGVFSDPEFRFAVGFTLKTTALATLFACLTALAVSHILVFYTFPGKKIVETILGLPMMVPPLVNGVALLIFFGPVAGNALSSIGITVAFTPTAAVFAMWFVAEPFAIQMFRQAFVSADVRYTSLARTFGLSPLACFFRVQLPLARRGLVAGIAMTWARTAGEFGATAMLAGVTRLKTETLAAAIFLAMSNGDFDAAIYVSVILLCISAIVYVSISTWGNGKHGAVS